MLTEFSAIASHGAQIGRLRFGPATQRTCGAKRLVEHRLLARTERHALASGGFGSDLLTISSYLPQLKSQSDGAKARRAERG